MENKTKAEVVEEFETLVRFAKFVNSKHSSPIKVEILKDALKFLKTEDFGADYFENRSCPYYPCHNLEHMNCKYCHCPLYTLQDCGGNYRILENGVKDCSNCVYPHIRENDSAIQEMMALLCKSWASDKK